MAKVKTVRTKTRISVGSVVAICILGGLFLVVSILYAITLQTANNYALSLENLYEKNFYDLVDNINNTETKLAKTLSANDKNYQAKLLLEVAKNAYLAQENLNNLPYSLNGIDESVAFVNQVSGYSETLHKSLNNGKELSATELKTLENIYDSVLAMKGSLNDMSKDLWGGYNILNASSKLIDEKQSNNFTKQISALKSNNVDYPTMIYDGPFSDSMVKKAVKGLNENVVDENTAKANLLKIFSEYTDDMVEFKNEGKGNFETYNFSVNSTDKKDIAYIQMTKQGGKLLTSSSYNDKKAETLTLENAKAVALDFAKRNQFDNIQVVWADIVGDNAFVNLAPVENNVILYPDLIKLKIDLSNGAVLGYEATSYYTNHTNRTLGVPIINKSNAKAKVNKKFAIVEENLALIPLEYNQEKLCYEFVCKFGGDDYYVYINAVTGVEENILKVIKTNNGNLLM